MLFLRYRLVLLGVFAKLNVINWKRSSKRKEYVKNVIDCLSITGDCFIFWCLFLYSICAVGVTLIVRSVISLYSLIELAFDREYFVIITPLEILVILKSPVPVPWRKKVTENCLFLPIFGHFRPWSG